MRKTNNTKKVNGMKKSKSMKVAAVALALTLVTTCFAGGTFARYTTGDAGADSARVAQFGVVVTANGSTFADEYLTDNAAVAGTIAKSVVSKDGNVVAPGTEGDMVSMTIAGSPEVAVNVAYDADLQLANWEADGEFYCPIEITVDDETIKGTDFTSAADFEKAVEDAIEADSANYEANTDMATVDAPTVSWAWAFGSDNVKDTALGDQAAAGNAADIALEIATTVTQID